MSCVKLDRRSHAEIVTIDAFVLLEADGTGVPDFERGYVSTEQEAIKWKQRSPYYSYRHVEKRFVIHETASGVMDQMETDKAAAIVARLSKADRKLLAKYSQLLDEDNEA